MQPFFLLPAGALLAAIVAHSLALRLFPVFGLLDFPDRYGLKRRRLPYPTGILSVLLFLAFFSGFFAIGQKQTGVIIACLLLGIFSFIDDRTPLPFWLRLIAQAIVCFIVFAFGSRIYSITNPLGGILKLDTLTLTLPLFGPLPVASGVFTLVWLLVSINAMNWFDGIPGQVSVLSSVGFLLLGFLALFRDIQPDVALLAFLLFALSLGSAIFDFPPGKVLMGDTGSMFFGFMLGLLAIYHGGKVATAFAVLAVPFIDALIVIMRRIVLGRSPFQGGQDHLHHRLLAKGWSPRKIILLTTTISIIFGTVALFLSTEDKGIELILLVVVMFALTWYSVRDNNKIT